ncbi:MAG TPA: autotransporter domain-containing protein [Usitatibacter sp.]|jgi:outer membrane lipase/esterase|nr:autotransporter domain-containing protein [Usitatibacter sp.]
MKTKRLLPALVASALLAAAPAAMAQRTSNPGVFNNVVVFGDSLSDAGYFRPFLLGLGLPASVVAGMGRFTTNPGPVWSELVSQYYGTTPGPSNAGGNIYAQGGARVASSPGVSTPPGMPERPVSSQIAEYLAATGGAANPNTLYAIWAGANDVFYNLGALQAGQITATQLQANVLGAAAAEIQQIGRLQAAGARYIMVFGLPDIGATPAFSNTGATGAAVTQLSAGYNTTLWSGLASAGIRVIPVDAFSLFAEVRASPATYGFSNTTSLACGPFPPITTASSVTSFFCNPSNLVAPNASTTYTFADSVHPTTGVHAIIAGFTESLIDGPIQYSMLAESALPVRESVVRTLNDGMLAQRRGPVGGWHLFGNIGGGSFDVDQGGGISGLDSSVRSVAVGIASRISDTVTLGAALSQGDLDGTFGSNAGTFKTRDRAVSFFGAVDWAGFYGTGVVSVGNLKFHDVQRNIFLGPATRTATASPEGSSSSAFFTAGYDFRFRGVRVGPVATLNSGKYDINGFDESNAGSANLHIADQSRNSEVWGLGIAASADFAGWTPWIRVTADRERRDDGRMVTAMPLSLAATGNSYDLPAYNPDRDFVTWAGGVSGYVMPRFALALNLYSIQSRSGIKDEGAGLTASVKF